MKTVSSILASVLFLISLPAAAIPILHLVPTTSAITVGDSVGIDVVVSGLEDELIGAYDLNIGWDDGFLSLASVDFGIFLDGPLDSIQGFAADATNVNVFEVSLGLLGNQTGEDAFRLFTMNFNALADGVAASFFDSSATQIVGNELGAEYLAIEFVGARITINPAPTSVPEPGTLFLILLGLGMLAVRRVGDAAGDPR